MADLPKLDVVIEKHFGETLYRSQAYLDDVLRRMGVEVFSP